MVDYVRAGKGPAIANIRVTREESHSGSDDQSHYMEVETQRYHIEHDPSRNMARELIEDGVFSPQELASVYDEIDAEVKTKSDEMTAEIERKTPPDVLTKVYSYDPATSEQHWQALVRERGNKRALRYREFHQKGYFDTPELPENKPPMTLRKAINYTLFDIFMLSDDSPLFDEDVADSAREIFLKGPQLTGSLRGKWGVFLVTKDLQRAFGLDRVHNTALDEAGILGRAVGHAYQGRIPFPEIQFLEYTSPG